MINFFGPSWTFSEGVRRYDQSFCSDLEVVGHEIDSPAHETSVPYYQAREYIINAGGNPTQVVSGTSETEIYGKMIYFNRYYPKFRTHGRVALPGHGTGENLSGWVWRPARDNRLEHGPTDR